MTDGDKKGKRFMREVCRDLSWWISRVDSPRQEDLPFRVRSTALMPIDGHWRNAGDIVVRPDVAWPFTVECKCDERGRMDAILEAPKWPVWSWWEQAKEQAERNADVPLLIFSRARRKKYTVLPAEVAACLQLKPRSAPVLEVVRPSGERLTIAVLDDLMGVSSARVASLPRRLRASSTAKTPRSASQKKKATRSRRRAASGLVSSTSSALS